jgi:Asp/Glu/hydantoin racemase
MMDFATIDPIRLFGDYMKIAGVPSLDHESSPDAGLEGKTLGLINGASWISLWSCWFGRLLLPGVKLVNVGNEAVQLNFMRAHKAGEQVPPALNIDLFARFAEDTTSLYPVDAILITCSTMNRAYPAVREAVKSRGVPVVQIDEPMMEKAAGAGKRILAIATHGPTVENTKALLLETAARMGREIVVECAIVEEAFSLLGKGDIRAHNEAIARILRDRMKRDRFDAVVLAQLSMSVFAFSYPDRLGAFGAPVLTSGEEGFLRMREILRARPRR